MRKSAWALGVVGALAACGDPAAPHIDSFRFDGQAEDSPSVLLFSLSFLDDDGDLGGGVLETFVNGRASGLGPLSLERIFLWNALPLDARAGRLDLVMQLSGEALDDQQVFEVGVRAIDELGHVSEPASVRLRAELPFAQ